MVKLRLIKPFDDGDGPKKVEYLDPEARCVDEGNLNTAYRLRARFFLCLPSVPPQFVTFLLVL